MIKSNRAQELSELAFQQQEELLRDPNTPSKLRFEVSRDILDRAGYPRISGTTVQQTHKLLTGDDLRKEREAILTKWEEVKKEMKQLEGGDNVGNGTNEE